MRLKPYNADAEIRSDESRSEISAAARHFVALQCVGLAAAYGAPLTNRTLLRTKVRAPGS